MEYSKVCYWSGFCRGPSLLTISWEYLALGHLFKNCCQSNRAKKRKRKSFQEDWRVQILLASFDLLTHFQEMERQTKILQVGLALGVRAWRFCCAASLLQARCHKKSHLPWQCQFSIREIGDHLQVFPLIVLILGGLTRRVDAQATRWRIDHWGWSNRLYF